MYLFFALTFSDFPCAASSFSKTSIIYFGLCPSAGLGSHGASGGASRRADVAKGAERISPHRSSISAVRDFGALHFQFADIQLFKFSTFPRITLIRCVCPVWASLLTAK